MASLIPTSSSNKTTGNSKGPLKAQNKGVSSFAASYAKDVVVALIKEKDYEGRSKAVIAEDLKLFGDVFERMMNGN